MTLLHRLRLLSRRFGLDVTRYPSDTLGYRRIQLLRYYNVTTVLDVGASVGEYATDLRRLGFEGQIVSFEPLAESYAALYTSAARDPDWETVRTAVGDMEGTATLNVSSNRVSSSLLRMLPQHTHTAPTSEYVAEEEVPVARLDNAAAPYLSPGDRPFIKIDVQGYTDRVLKGAADLLDRTAGLEVELSLTPLYEGEMLFQEGVERMTGHGFALMGIEPGFVAPSGRTLQVDAVFFREVAQ